MSMNMNMSKSLMDDNNVGRTLSKYLRHLAENIRQDGFVLVSDVIDYFKKYNKMVTEEQLGNVCQTDKKMRFSLKEINGKRYIRANNGHSLTTVDEVQLCEQITEENIPEEAIHGTTVEAWEIIKNEGLKRMGRQSIHMACGLPSESSVVKSGIRKSSTIYIWIDVLAAMNQDKIQFSITENGVICTRHLIHPRFFSCVKNVVTGDILMGKEPLVR